MKIEDDKLDEMLRDVAVPGDLKSRLLAIVHDDVYDEDGEKAEIEKLVSVKQPLARNKMFFALAVAASLAALVAVPLWLNRDIGSTPNDTIRVAAISNLDNALEELKQLVEEVKESSTNSYKSLQNLEKLETDRNEIDALVQAIVGQTPMFLTGDLTESRRNMEQLVAGSPNTKGAEIARQFLAEN